MLSPLRLAIQDSRITVVGADLTLVELDPTTVDLDPFFTPKENKEFPESVTFGTFSRDGFGLENGVFRHTDLTCTYVASPIIEAETVTTALNLFDIPHPSPGFENHRLVHASLAAPEIAVFYRGRETLVDGKATIQLPDYFVALTREEGRTVQLTPIAELPFLLGYANFEGGSFDVFGSIEDGEFFWEVTAVRADVEPLVAVLDELAL